MKSLIIAIMVFVNLLNVDSTVFDAEYVSGINKTQSGCEFYYDDPDTMDYEDRESYGFKIKADNNAYYDIISLSSEELSEKYEIVRLGDHNYKLVRI